MPRSTLPRPGKKSAAAWIASGPPQRTEAFIASLSGHALRALPWLFDFWALDHQLPPAGEWRSWVILGGRGAGKTRAGAEWVRAIVEGATPLGRGKARRLALVGETYDQAREVMVFGDSGILACSPPDRRPKWEATRRRLVWPNGAVAQLHSATEPEALRGPQFDAAWLDEFAKWRRAREAWDMLQFALRLGRHPRQVITTTPRNVPVLREVLEMEETVVSRAPTEANRANLAKSFLRAIKARYGGTRLGRQELAGELLESIEGALWPPDLIEKVRLKDAGEMMGTLDRVVIGVDPPVTGHQGSDACGIVVVGAQTAGPSESWRAVVLADRSVKAASPARWARAAVEAYHAFEADLIVAEVNQGGDMVEAVVRQIDPLVPVRPVRARRGKAIRAEPVAALYEQGRVHHAPGLEALEDEMGRMTRHGYEGQGSPDRTDALVWAIWALMIDQGAGRARPAIRQL